MPFATPFQARKSMTESDKISVLLIESDDSIRELIFEMLPKHGYHVVCSYNSLSALAIANDPANHFDLLLIESSPPGMQLGQLVHELLAIQPQAKTIFISGSFCSALAAILGPQPNRRLLLKPFVRRDLIEKIQGVLRGGDESEIK